MSLKVGALERRVKETDNGEIIAYVGRLDVAQVISGNIAIAEKKSTVGKEWPLEVKVYQDGSWASLGSAKWERSNPQSNYYMRIVLNTPIIQRKLGESLWVRAFPDGDDKSGAPGTQLEYDLVWGNGGGRKKTEKSQDINDEIPFR